MTRQLVHEKKNAVRLILQLLGGLPMGLEEEEAQLPPRADVGLSELESLEERKAVLEKRLAEAKEQLTEAKESSRQLEAEIATTRAELEIADRETPRSERRADRAQRELERIDDRIEKAMLLIHDGAKSLALLNSAAAAAMLAFSQTIVAQPTLHALKPFVVGALACFLVGALVASALSVPLARVMVSMMNRASDARPNSWFTEFKVNWIPRDALFAFFAGASSMVVALWLRP